MPKKKEGCVAQTAKLGCLAVLLLVGFVFLVPALYKKGDKGGAAGQVSIGESDAAKALEYLLSVDDVAWHKVTTHDVFIGFREPLPEDWNMIIRGAAVNANRAVGHRFHAWAVPAGNRDFKPGKDPDFGSVTAQDGKIR